MIIDSNLKIAVTCEKCGRINVEQLNLFELNKIKDKKLSCSCGSLNCTIYSSGFRNINLNINCIDCGEEHIYNYKLKEILSGIQIACPEIDTLIAIIGDQSEIS